MLRASTASPKGQGREGPPSSSNRSVSGEGDFGDVAAGPPSPSPLSWRGGVQRCDWLPEPGRHPALQAHLTDVPTITCPTEAPARRRGSQTARAQTHKEATGVAGVAWGVSGGTSQDELTFKGFPDGRAEPSLLPRWYSAQGLLDSTQAQGGRWVVPIPSQEVLLDFILWGSNFPQHAVPDGACLPENSDTPLTPHKEICPSPPCPHCPTLLLSQTLEGSWRGTPTRGELLPDAMGRSSACPELWPTRPPAPPRTGSVPTGPTANWRGPRQHSPAPIKRKNRAQKGPDNGTIPAACRAD